MPHSLLPTEEIEDYVVDGIRKVDRDRELAKAVFDETRDLQKDEIAKLEAE